ncbi:MAG: T9SS type A sorting domain-containing protein [Flavobacteriales bacterium]|nr:T9SS type A sorting domain-containing protein [Flavobacteriales bacterium]
MNNTLRTLSLHGMRLTYCVLLLLAFFPCVPVAAQWNLIQTRPTPITLSSVRFFNANTGIAVGGYGTLIRTTDAGVTWSHVASGTEQWLTRIAILDAQTAVVCGDYSTVIRTTDQGLTWTTVTTPGPLDTYHDMSFPTPLVGYLGSSSNSTNSLLKTLDGGLSWSIVPLAAANNIWSVFFLTDLLGYAGVNDGKLMRTMDGGTSWAEVYDDQNNIDLIYFRNASLGFFGTSAGLRKTTNGGTNWGGLYQDQGKVYSMWHTPGSNLLFAGGTYGTVARTDTNALFWTPLFSLLDPFDIQGLCSPSDSLVIAVGSAGLIYRSTNAGGVWTKIQTGYPYTIRDVHFRDDSLAFSCGERGTILKTTDGFWNESRKNDNANVILYRIKFPSPDTGFACGTGRRILRSINGGSNWSLALPSIPGGSPIVDIEFAGNGVAYACMRDEELILRTPDGGSTWDTIHRVPAALPDLNDLHLINDSTLLLAGTAGLLMRSTDAGASFQPCTVVGGNPSANMLEFEFPSPMIGYARSGNNLYMRTTDGGITWTPFQFPLGYLNDLQFINDSVGYFLAGDRLFWTNDGGSTLASQPIPKGFDMFQIHVNTAGTVYLFGVNGAILTNDSAVTATVLERPLPTSEALAMSVYPNPSSAEFTIALDPDIVDDTAELMITDISGRVLYRSLVARQARLTLNLHSLKYGVYLIHLLSGTERFTTRLVRSGPLEQP